MIIDLLGVMFINFYDRWGKGDLIPRPIITPNLSQ